MKTLIVFLGLLLLVTPSFSQDDDFEKPNYKKIEKAISKKKSELYYPKLMERFLNSDWSMSLEERRHLYYGFIYEPNYSPYGNSDYNDSIKPLLQMKDHDTTHLLEIIRLSDLIMLDKPFDLDAINYKLYALDELGREAAFEKCIHQFRIIVDAIMSSGNGLEDNTAFYVIYISHEYDLLNILDFQFGGQQSLIGTNDYLKVAENEQDVEGLYFDVSPCLNHLNSMFSD